MGPVLAFWITRRWCISLQRADQDRLLHGYETGVHHALPRGCVRREAPADLQRRGLHAHRPGPRRRRADAERGRRERRGQPQGQGDAAAAAAVEVLVRQQHPEADPRGARGGPAPRRSTSWRSTRTGTSTSPAATTTATTSSTASPPTATSSTAGTASRATSSASTEPHPVLDEAPSTSGWAGPRRRPVHGSSGRTGRVGGAVGRRRARLAQRRTQAAPGSATTSRLRTASTADRDAARRPVHVTSGV